MGRTAHQTIHMDCSGLAKPVASVLGLAVNLRIEINIVQNDSVCSCQVQALSSCSSGQQKDKDAIGGIVKPASSESCL